MALGADFNTMLNENITSKLLENEIKKKQWALTNFEVKKDWVSEAYALPHIAGYASSTKFGAFTASNDIATNTYGRGQATPKEFTASMLFKEQDLAKHGKVSEQNFLKMLPDMIDQFTLNCANKIGRMLLSGEKYAIATANGDASGNITVAQPELFEVNMKVQVDDDNSSPVDCYVRTVDINTGVITLYDARTGGSAVNLSGYTTAQNACIYLDSAQGAGFTSVFDVLTPSSLGGASSVYGLTKTASPYYQGVVASGADITASNILQKVFNQYVNVKRIGQANPTKILMSYKNFGACMSVVESSKGAFYVTGKEASQYGWDSIKIGGKLGSIEIVATPEMINSHIWMIDPSLFAFATNGFMRMVKSPEGISYYTVRDTTGYSYIVDFVVRGDLIVKKPICSSGGLVSVPDFAV